MISDENAYELEYNGHRTGFFVSLSETLLSKEWDVITIQQASHFSTCKDSYQPYASELADYIRKCLPKAKLYIHQTWAYEKDSQKLLEVAKCTTPEEMLALIVDAYSLVAKETKACGIIRSGELFAALSKCGISGIHRDTFHASLGIGRYALGLLWYHTLTGRSVYDNSFCDFDEPISYDIIKIIKNQVEVF